MRATGTLDGSSDAFMRATLAFGSSVSASIAALLRFRPHLLLSAMAAFAFWCSTLRFPTTFALAFPSFGNLGFSSLRWCLLKILIAHDFCLARIVDLVDRRTLASLLIVIRNHIWTFCKALLANDVWTAFAIFSTCFCRLYLLVSVRA